jgi:hypothetical protein
MPIETIPARSTWPRRASALPRWVSLMGGTTISYGTNVIDAYHQVGSYVGRILKGERSEALPDLPTVGRSLVARACAREPKISARLEGAP